MKLGFFTMPLHPPGSSLADSLAADLEQVVTLDKMGYEEAWFGEHFTSEWESLPSPDLLIAAAIPQTKRIKLGTGVICMPSHNPFQVAHRIAILDNLARGRFYFGVGSGGYPGDLEAFEVDGASGEQRVITREAIDVILDLWKDPKPGQYHHKHWTFTVPEVKPGIGQKFHIKPFQKPYPPIAVAGVNAKSDTLLLAGERGWIPMSINLVPPATLITHWSSVMEGAKKTGRTPDRSQWRIAREIYVADTTEQARKEAMAGVMVRDFNEYLIPMLKGMQYMKLIKSDPAMPDGAVTPEYLMDNLWLVGSPDEVAQKIRNLHKTVGGFGTLLVMGHEWKPKDKWVHSMDLLMNRVMPKVADLK